MTDAIITITHVKDKEVTFQDTKPKISKGLVLLVYNNLLSQKLTGELPASGAELSDKHLPSICEGLGLI
jgi:hypothetical protein